MLCPADGWLCKGEIRVSLFSVLKSVYSCVKACSSVRVHCLRLQKKEDDISFYRELSINELLVEPKGINEKKSFTVDE